MTSKRGLELVGTCLLCYRYFCNRLLWFPAATAASPYTLPYSSTSLPIHSLTHYPYLSNNRLSRAQILSSTTSQDRNHHSLTEDIALFKMKLIPIFLLVIMENCQKGQFLQISLKTTYNILYQIGVWWDISLTHLSAKSWIWVRHLGSMGWATKSSN